MKLNQLPPEITKVLQRVWASFFLKRKKKRKEKETNALYFYAATEQ